MGDRGRDQKFKRKQTGGKLLLWADGRRRGRTRERGKVICPTGALTQPTYIHLTKLGIPQLLVLKYVLK